MVSARVSRLEPDEIVEAAAAMIEADGVEAFSMRKLAARLDVNPMTVYLRFANKDELLDAVVARALGSLDLPTGHHSDLAGALVEWAGAIRARVGELEPYRPLLGDSPRLVTSMLRAADDGLALLTVAGLPTERAVEVFRAVFWHAIGFALAEPTIRGHAAVALADGLASSESDDLPHLRAAALETTPVDPDELFRSSTDALVTGLLTTIELPEGAST